ncbi:MAG: helix-turn-helix domain-containing protein, partial [Gammaproteobacteria bacterium]|nr:helix-turn-helix domain-containing protein [Gammaproteobacteria bacterium]
MSLSMKELFILVAHLLTTLVRLARPGGVRSVLAQSLALKHQLLVVQRRRKRAPRLTPWDRLFFGLCSHWLSPRRQTKTSIVLRPSTFTRFHQALVRCKYRFLYTSRRRSRPGPKGPSAELIAAVVEMKRRNPKFGYLKIAQQISHAFGVELDKDVVRRILQQYGAGYPPGSGPSWLTALAHARDSLWSLDLFRCESILLQSCWVMVIIDVFSRRFVGFAVQRGEVDGPGVCRMFNYARFQQGLPKHLSTDHDPLFRFHRWLANLRILEIEEIKSVPHAPVSHPFVERMIRTIREELLDQVLFWNLLDLERKLSAFQTY